ncbi:DUF1378 family protein [Lonsdalea quercina]
MTLIETGMLYFSTAVGVLYLVSGGYKSIKAYVEKKIDAAAAAKASTKAE